MTRLARLTFLSCEPQPAEFFVANLEDQLKPLPDAVRAVEAEDVPSNRPSRSARAYLA